MVATCGSVLLTLQKRMDMNDLIPKENYLPTTLDELQEWIIVNKEILNAHKAKIRAIEKVNMAVAAKEAALQDGQYMAELILDAEVRLGELLDGIDKSVSKLKGKDRGSKGGTTKKTLPPNIDKKQSYYAQQIANNPDVVEEVKQTARDKGELPTAADVRKAIHKKQGTKEKIFKEELVSPHFQRAFDLFFNQVLAARSENWKTTSKEVALSYLDKIKALITVQQGGENHD